MSRQTRDTVTSHHEIRRWIQSRNGRPASLREEHAGGEHSLHIEFPGHSDERNMMELISWDAFFEKFESERLALLYDNPTNTNGDHSSGYRFVEREAPMEDEQSVSDGEAILSAQKRPDFTRSRLLLLKTAIDAVKSQPENVQHKET